MADLIDMASLIWAPADTERIRHTQTAALPTDVHLACILLLATARGLDLGHMIAITHACMIDGGPPHVHTDLLGVIFLAGVIQAQNLHRFLQSIILCSLGPILAHNRLPGITMRPKLRIIASSLDGKNDIGALVSEFVDGIVMKQEKEGECTEEDDKQLAEMEEALMKKLGIPVSFDSTKGKQVADLNVYAVKRVSKRQAGQYMNQRCGFNKPLPAEIISK